MIFYVTFGVQYGTGKNQELHPLGFSCDGWVEIEAASEEAARAEAFRLLDRRWSMIYPEWDFRTSYHPLGCMAKATAGGWIEGTVLPISIGETDG